MRADTEPRQSAQVGGGIVTVRVWGERWLKRREQEGVRSVEDDRSRWRTHVLTAPWADRPLSKVTSTDAVEWLSSMCAKHSSNPTHRNRERPLAASTVKNALNLVRSAFESATEEGLCRLNVFRTLRVRRSRFARTAEKWTFLYPHEFSVLSLLPKTERRIARLALWLGVRQSELWGLHVSDVHLDDQHPHIIVRYSKARTKRFSYAPEPTKSGKPRKVPVIPIARATFREWMTELPSFAPHNPRGLVFPKPSGKARGKGRLCRGWMRVVQALGRPFRFHDLRHSCATALLAGWLTDRPWTLRAVQAMLGHSTIVMTERYAHMIEETLMLEAAGVEPETRVREKVDMNEVEATVAIDETGEATVQVAPVPVGHLSSVVEQRFRNSDAFPLEGDKSGDREEGDGDGDEPPSPDERARVVTDAETLVRILRLLNALTRTERLRVLAALRASFPGEWPADRVIGGGS